MARLCKERHYGTPIDYGSNSSQCYGIPCLCGADCPAISKDDAVVLAQVTHAVFVSVRMFVVGAAVPTVAWGIAALEFDRSHTTKRSVASATMYALLVVSLILFCVAGWRLPRAFLDSLQITVEFNDAL